MAPRAARIWWVHGPENVPPPPSASLGPLSSMVFRASSRSCCPLIQAVMPFQKVPAPTAPGIWSEPSNRNTVDW
jgi:hypothetical protein